MRACGLERRLLWVVVVASWWMISHSAIVFADEPASSQVSGTGADVATSVQQEPKPDAASPPAAAKWQYNGFVDASYLLDFNHPANHLFRSRSTRQPNGSTTGSSMRVICWTSIIPPTTYSAVAARHSKWTNWI